MQRLGRIWRDLANAHCGRSTAQASGVLRKRRRDRDEFDAARTGFGGHTRWEAEGDGSSA